MDIIQCHESADCFPCDAIINGCLEQLHHRDGIIIAELEGRLGAAREIIKGLKSELEGREDAYHEIGVVNLGLRDEIQRQKDEEVRLLRRIEQLIIEKHELNKTLRKVYDLLAQILEINEQVKAASDKLGAWMSAALEDDTVCEIMKVDIRNWFEVLENL